MSGNQDRSISLDWLDGETIRPYIYVREGNRTYEPGTRFDSDWFPFQPMYLNPLAMDQVSFADQILDLESKAFKKSGMGMPRWVFYDCAIMPGFVAGFAYRTEKLPPSFREAVDVNDSQEWTPISLFITIPARSQGEWVAHNLTSINSLLPREDRLYGLGFMTKAFSLFHANIGNLCGVTQWKSPAIRLHSHFGPFEVLTAYTPVHSYAHSLTYRTLVDPHYWTLFFTKKEAEDFDVRFVKAGFKVDPGNEASLIEFQKQIESSKGPFFLSSKEIREQKLDDELNVYMPR